MKILLIIIFLFITGCAGSTGDISSDNPTERGFSYVAAAIITSAVIRAIFNR